MLESLLEKPADVVIGQAVVNELSHPAASNDVELPESSQLMRNGRLAHADESGEIGRTELAQGQGVHDADARRVPQDLKRLGENLRLRDGKDPALYVCREGLRNRRRSHD